MGRKISDGQSVKVAVPESTEIKQGEFVLLGGFFGLAVRGVATGPEETAEVVLNIEPGEYETSQITETDDFGAGDAVYFNEATKLLTTQANLDANGNPQNRPVGRVTQAKDANNVIWFVLGPQVQAHPTS